MGNIISARLQCHHAAQFNTKVARALAPPKDDDSHTSLIWNQESLALVGDAFPIGGERARLQLHPADLSLALFQENGEEMSRLALDGLTLEDGLAWLAGHGIDQDALSKPLHFELEDHPLLHGTKFQVLGNESAFEDLSKVWEEAAIALDEVRKIRASGPVRCWPHHFDMATLIATTTGSIGFGMSPGDGNYPEPYYYVSPSPYSAVDRLSPLKSRGTWHKENWVGAVLTWDRFASDVDRQHVIRYFLDDAFQALLQSGFRI